MPTTGSRNSWVKAAEVNAVRAAVIHKLRDQWWTPEEVASALNLPLPMVQHWWTTDAEKLTWTPAMKAQYGKYMVQIDLHG